MIMLAEYGPNSADSTEACSTWLDDLEPGPLQLVGLVLVGSAFFVLGGLALLNYVWLGLRLGFGTELVQDSPTVRASYPIHLFVGATSAATIAGAVILRAVYRYLRP